MSTAAHRSCRYVAFGESPRDIPIVVVDLGYSARRKSCGLYWTGAERPEELTFGNTIRSTAAIIKEKGHRLLVLEAPLSTFHATSGNPDVRGDFERGRGWYHGAGASTFAGAVRFLAALSELLTGELLLAEAFLSNKDGPTAHGEDAVQIHDSFWRTLPVELEQGVEAGFPLISGIPSVRVFVAGGG
jgi:hypothetical protein